MPICIINQNTGSVGFACHVVPNITNTTIAIHPKRPILKAARESVSALIKHRLLASVISFEKALTINGRVLFISRSRKLQFDF